MAESSGCRWGRKHWRLLELHNTVCHAGEIQLAGQLAQHRALASSGLHIVLLEQHHRLGPGLAITVLEVLQHLLNDEVVDLGELVQRIAHETGETRSLASCQLGTVSLRRTEIR